MHLCLFFFLAKSLNVVFGCTLSTNKMILYYYYFYNYRELIQDKGGSKTGNDVEKDDMPSLSDSAVMQQPDYGERDDSSVVTVG